MEPMSPIRRRHYAAQEHGLRRALLVWVLFNVAGAGVWLFGGPPALAWVVAAIGWLIGPLLDPTPRSEMDLFIEEVVLQRREELDRDRRHDPSQFRGV
jgi:hypothetical protein